MSITSRLKNDFVAGLLLVAPLALTVFVLQFAFRRLSGILDPLVQSTGLVQLTGNVEIAAQLLAAVFVVLLITGLGVLADVSIGQRLFGGFDRLIGLVPVVSVIYSGARQVGNALTQGESRYESVVVVEYPRVGVYSLGFVTGDAPDAAQEIAGQRVYNVFVPNSPNPTAGNLILAPEDRITESDLSVRQGLRLVLTTGITTEREEMEALTGRDDIPQIP